MVKKFLSHIVASVMLVNASSLVHAEQSGSTWHDNRKILWAGLSVLGAGVASFGLYKAYQNHQKKLPVVSNMNVPAPQQGQGVQQNPVRFLGRHNANSPRSGNWAYASMLARISDVRVRNAVVVQPQQLIVNDALPVVPALFVNQTCVTCSGTILNALGLVQCDRCIAESHPTPPAALLNRRSNVRDDEFAARMDIMNNIQDQINAQLERFCTQYHHAGQIENNLGAINDTLKNTLMGMGFLTQEEANNGEATSKSGMLWAQLMCSFQHKAKDCMKSCDQCSYLYPKKQLCKCPHVVAQESPRSKGSVTVMSCVGCRRLPTANSMSIVDGMVVCSKCAHNNKRLLVKQSPEAPTCAICLDELGKNVPTDSFCNAGCQGHQSCVNQFKEHNQNKDATEVKCPLCQHTDAEIENKRIDFMQENGLENSDEE